MSPTQTIKEKKKTPARNKPCPCGSGKKYKKCCGAVDESLAPGVAKKVLKNTFREEVKDPLAGISPEELLWRDRTIMLAQYETKKKLTDSDNKHLDQALNTLKELRTFVSEQPISEGREPALRNINNQLEDLKRQKADLVFSRPMEIIILSLRLALDRDSDKKPTEAVVESEDKKMESVLSDGPGPEQKPMPGDGPIETDDDDDDLDGEPGSEEEI